LFKLKKYMKKEYLYWMKKADSDLRKAKILRENNEFDGVTFYAQQTAEKALKSISIYKNLGIIKTHDLLLLGKKVKLPENILEKAVVLNSFYTSSRYPILIEEQDISEQSADKSLSYAGEVLKWCKQQITT